MRTWLAERDVDGKKVDLFMGHARPEDVTSRTAARRIHLKPSYLAEVQEAVEKFFVALAPLTQRSLGGQGVATFPARE